MGITGIYLTTVLFGFLASGTYGVMHSKSYMGCYVDSLPRAFPDYYDTGLTVASCYQKAIELGYEMFAIQNGGECWLDDSKQNNYNKYGKADKCGGETGGKWLNSVYRIKTFCTRQTEEGLCCVFPFMYESEPYLSCTTKGHSREWCATTADYDEDGDWGNCVDPCESGWHYFKNNCYKVFHEQVRTWEDSRSKCKSLGADLAKISSRVENNFVGRLLPKTLNAWVGLHREKDEKFYWPDRSRPTYSYWDRNEPNNKDGKEDCTEIRRKSYVWNDVTCSHRIAYVCQKGI